MSEFFDLFLVVLYFAKSGMFVNAARALVEADPNPSIVTVPVQVQQGNAAIFLFDVTEPNRFSSVPVVNQATCNLAKKTCPCSFALVNNEALLTEYVGCAS